jgi:hypothetical protein
MVHDRLYWTRQTKRLRDWLRAEHGIELNVSSKLQGYRYWWERLAVWAVVTFWSVGEAIRGPLNGARARAQRQFDYRYITTFGDRVYWKAGEAFDAGSMDDFAILLHEAVHAVQRRVHKRFALQYLLWPFPVFWTRRASFERVAYHQQLRVYYLVGVGEERLNQMLRAIDPLFWGGTYAWMDLSGSRLSWKKLEAPGVLEAIGFELE